MIEKEPVKNQSLPSPVSPVVSQYHRRRLVSIDAMGCHVAIAQSILDAGADY